jgi:hypothetical protein
MRMPYQAKVARNVLKDCRYALTELRDDALAKVRNDPGAAYRVRWFGALAMLRAVGHVLRKVDAKSSPHMASANSAWWDNLKLTRLAIWEFIDDDRDALLKEYDYRAAQNVTVTVGGPTVYTYEMRGGPFSGQDQRDVYQLAIEWWDQQLAHIETEAARIAGISPS